MQFFEKEFSDCSALANVRYGPKADMCSAKRHVRESAHRTHID